jgi:hypothetical protein
MVSFSICEDRAYFTPIPWIFQPGRTAPSFTNPGQAVELGNAQKIRGSAKGFD